MRTRHSPKKSTTKAATQPAAKRGGTAVRARAAGATKPARAGATVRKQVLIEVNSLEGAMEALGTTNMSKTVNIALERLAEDAAILRGIDAAMGEIPDFPYLDT